MKILGVKCLKPVSQKKHQSATAGAISIFNFERCGELTSCRCESPAGASTLPSHKRVCGTSVWQEFKPPYDVTMEHAPKAFT